jgi:hypothetical protein
MKKEGTAAALALTAMMVAQPAQACWTNAETDAAKVANLNMLMMVSALRCRSGQDNFLNEYNRFVSLNNGAIGSQNAAVRSHFARMDGNARAEGATDRFIIEIANHYGSGHQTLDCAELRAVAGQLAQPGHDARSLLAMAEMTVEEVPLPGGQCAVTIASK